MQVLNYMDQRTSADKEIMVPLTSSLYVPGHMEDKNVLVEAGAGYFIEKDIKGATEYCTRKQKFMKESMDKVGQLIQTKKFNLNKVQQELQKRVKAMQEQMAAAGKQ